MGFCLHRYGEEEPGSALTQGHYAGKPERVFTRCHRCGKIYHERLETVIANLAKITVGPNS